MFNFISQICLILSPFIQASQSEFCSWMIQLKNHGTSNSVSFKIGPNLNFQPFIPQNNKMRKHFDPYFLHLFAMFRQGIPAMPLLVGSKSSLSFCAWAKTACRSLGVKKLENREQTNPPTSWHHDGIPRSQDGKQILRLGCGKVGKIVKVGILPRFSSVRFFFFLRLALGWNLVAQKAQNRAPSPNPSHSK